MANKQRCIFVLIISSMLLASSAFAAGDNFRSLKTLFPKLSTMKENGVRIMKGFFARQGYQKLGQHTVQRTAKRRGTVAVLWLIPPPKVEWKGKSTGQVANMTTIGSYLLMSKNGNSAEYNYNGYAPIRFERKGDNLKVTIRAIEDIKLKGKIVGNQVIINSGKGISGIKELINPDLGDIGLYQAAGKALSHNLERVTH